MLTTNRADVAELAEKLRNHGAAVSEEQRHRGPRPYLLPDFNLLGFNYRMTDLQGAVGLVQLDKLDIFVRERSARAEWYRQELSGIDWLRLPQEPPGGRHAWQAFVTYVAPERAPAPRNDLMERLQGLGVATRPGTHAVHQLGYHAGRFGFSSGDFPAASDCEAQSLAIPLHNRMDEEDYQHVVDAIRSL